MATTTVVLSPLRHANDQQITSPIPTEAGHNDGWREAMVGTISLYDCDGERQHTTYFGAAPEHGKATFLKRFERELERVKAQYLGIADGAKDNWSDRERHTNRQLLDFFHVTEYLAKSPGRLIRKRRVSLSASSGCMTDVTSSSMSRTQPGIFSRKCALSNANAS